MPARYQVHLRNHDGDRIAVFPGIGRDKGGVKSIELNIYLDLPGDFTIRLEAADERIADFQDDYIIDFVRRTSTLPWYRLFTGFHRHLEYEFDDQGVETFVSEGYGLNDLLVGEPIYYAPLENLPSTSTSSSTSTTITTTSTSTSTTSTSTSTTSSSTSVSLSTSISTSTTSTSTSTTISTSTSTSTTGYWYYGCKEGPAETVAKEYVYENIGKGAHPNRQRQGLVIEADEGRGAEWSGCRAYENLFDVLLELAIHGPGDFAIEMDEPKVGESGGDPVFRFKWRSDHWGEDKRRDNPDNRPAVIFSPKFGNISKETYTRSRKKETNVVYVLGQGGGQFRRIVTETSVTHDDTPWSRRAVTRDARMIWDEDELRAKGDEFLDKGRRDEWTDIVTREVEGCKFDEHYSLGDLVTVEIPRLGLEPDQKIVGFKIKVDADGEKVTALTEDIV